MSWYEPAAELSLSLIQEARLPADAAIIDVGRGTSTLAGQLLDAGYTDVTVADILPQALQRARLELTDAELIHWAQADLRTRRFGRRYDLWHDRAVFHFMSSPPTNSAISPPSAIAAPRRSPDPRDLWARRTDSLQRTPGQPLQRRPARRRARR